ncbi:MAG: sensor histidine kinase [Spirochaetia bacterium]
MRIDKHIDNISLPTKTTISLGLIINEVTANAIKHGFNNTEEAVFSITMEKNNKENQYELTLSNTGSPFPEDIDAENTSTLGLRLINTLVDQLAGTIKLQRKPYPVFTIKFPVED